MNAYEIYTIRPGTVPYALRDVVDRDIIRIKLLNAREDIEREAKERGLKTEFVSRDSVHFKVRGRGWGISVDLDQQRTPSYRNNGKIYATVDGGYRKKKVFPEGKNGLNITKIVDDLVDKIAFASREVKRQREESNLRETEKKAIAKQAAAMNLSWNSQIGYETGRGEVSLKLSIPLEIYSQTIDALAELGALGKLYLKEKSA